MSPKSSLRILCFPAKPMNPATEDVSDTQFPDKHLKDLQHPDPHFGKRWLHSLEKLLGGGSHTTLGGHDESFGKDRQSLTALSSAPQANSSSQLHTKVEEECGGITH